MQQNKKKIIDSLKNERFNKVERPPGGGKPRVVAVTDPEEMKKMAVEKAQKRIKQLTRIRQIGKKQGRKFEDEAAVIKYFKDPKNSEELSDQSESFQYYISIQ